MGRAAARDPCLLLSKLTVTVHADSSAAWRATVAWRRGVSLQRSPLGQCHRGTSADTSDIGSGWHLQSSGWTWGVHLKEGALFRGPALFRQEQNKAFSSSMSEF